MASRKEQKEALKQERLEREQAAAAADRRRRLIGYGVGGALALAAIVAVVIAISAGGGGGHKGDGKSGTTVSYGKGSVPKQRIADLAAAAKAARCTVRTYPNFGRNHVTGFVKYKTNPPTSGNHYPAPASDGAYPQAPRTEQLVHALEHGRVIVWFQPKAPQSVVNDLKALFDEDPVRVILTPDETGMSFEVAATAWRHLLGCPRMNPKVFDAIRAFKAAYRDKAPEKILGPE